MYCTVSTCLAFRFGGNSLVNPCGTNSTTQYSKNGTFWLLAGSFFWQSQVAALGPWGAFFAALLHWFVLLEGFTCMRKPPLAASEKRGKTTTLCEELVAWDEVFKPQTVAQKVRNRKIFGTGSRLKSLTSLPSWRYHIVRLNRIQTTLTCSILKLLIKPEFGAKHRDPNSIFYGKGGEKTFQILLRSNQEQHNNVACFFPIHLFFGNITYKTRNNFTSPY